MTAHTFLLFLWLLMLQDHLVGPTHMTDWIFCGLLIMATDLINWRPENTHLASYLAIPSHRVTGGNLVFKSL